jgi:hypothetical protein
MSQQIWQTLYPQNINIFIFSNGWFWRFLRRHDIVRQMITKMATKPPEEVVKVVNYFIQYIRRNNRREGNWAATRDSNRSDLSDDSTSDPTGGDSPETPSAPDSCSFPINRSGSDNFQASEDVG